MKTLLKPEAEFEQKKTKEMKSPGWFRADDGFEYTAPKMERRIR
jgi:hypothetical protein